MGIGIGKRKSFYFVAGSWQNCATGYLGVVPLFLSGVIFAVAHFIKPLAQILQTSPQFVGLLLLGTILAAGRYINRGHGLNRPFTSLGLPIGFHAGWSGDITSLMWQI